MSLFEDWPRDFWETTERTDAIVAAMAAHDFTGKVVLDIGCLRGMYAYHALKLGASHVTLIDRNDTALKYAESRLRELNPDGDRFTCVFGDFHAEKFPEKVDIVLALGILYHTYRQHEVMAKINSSQPDVVLLETIRNPPSDFMEVHYWATEMIHVPNAKMCEFIFRECGYRSWAWESFMPGRGIYTLR